MLMKDPFTELNDFIALLFHCIVSISNKTECFNKKQRCLLQSYESKEINPQMASNKYRKCVVIQIMCVAKRSLDQNISYNGSHRPALLLS